MASGKARIDLGRVATTAIETTLNGERRRRHRRPRIQTLATGAVLLAAVRVGQKGLPSGSLKLMKLGARTLGDLREVREVLKDRLTDRDVAEIMIGEGLARSYVCAETRCPRRKGWCE